MAENEKNDEKELVCGLYPVHCALEERLMFSLFKSGEICAFEDLSDAQLERCLRMRFPDPNTWNQSYNMPCFDVFRLKEVHIDGTNLRDVDAVRVSSNRGLEHLDEMMRQGVHLKAISLPFFHCWCAKSLALRTNCIYWQGFDAFHFAWKHGTSNPFVEHIAFTGYLEFSQCCLFTPTNCDMSSCAPSRTRKYKSMTLFVNDNNGFGNRSNQHLESIITLLEMWQPAENFLLFFRHSDILPSHLCRILSLRGLRVLHASLDFRATNAFVQNHFQEQVYKTALKNPTLICAKITMNNHNSVQMMDLSAHCARNRNTRLFYRVIDVVASLFVFQLPPYVLLWIMNRLYAFCFESDRRKVAMIHKCAELCETLLSARK